jgi:tetratricopeptide (TPR) repeat protein
LVEAYPHKAISWFTIGCYYLLVSKNELAQRHFHKATKLDARCAAAWIGNGHAYAAQEESEQALQMYRTAARLFQGSHLPLLFMGMEYLKTNNRILSANFLAAARKLCAHDPLVHNELGVMAYREGLYDDAVDHFLRVLSLYRLARRRKSRKQAALAGAKAARAAAGGGASASAGAGDAMDEAGDDDEVYEDDYDDDDDDDDDDEDEGFDDPGTYLSDGKQRAGGKPQPNFSGRNLGVMLHAACATTVFNLGQCHRKLRRWGLAVRCFEAALTLEPKSASTHGALAFTHHLSGDLDAAIECYHKALALKPDDTFCDEMLKKALTEVFQIGGAFDLSALEAELDSGSGGGGGGTGGGASGGGGRPPRHSGGKGAAAVPPQQHELFSGTGGSDILPNDDSSMSSPGTGGFGGDRRTSGGSGFDSSMNMEEEDSYDLDASVDMSNDEEE